MKPRAAAWNLWHNSSNIAGAGECRRLCGLCLAAERVGSSECGSSGASDRNLSGHGMVHLEQRGAPPLFCLPHEQCRRRQHQGKTYPRVVGGSRIVGGLSLSQAAFKQLSSSPYCRLPRAPQEVANSISVGRVCLPTWAVHMCYRASAEACAKLFKNSTSIGTASTLLRDFRCGQA